MEIAVPAPVIDCSVMKTELDKRNEDNKEKLRLMYYNQAKQILMGSKFGYPDDISAEVADSVITHGDKLMTNSACEDSDDEDTEMDTLNALGDQFQALEKTICIMVTTAEEDQTKQEEEIRKMVPLPEHELYIELKQEIHFPKAMAQVKKVMKTASLQAVALTVAFLGQHNEDGIVFDNMTMPVAMIEKEVLKMMQACEEQLPFVTDIVFPLGEYMHVSHVYRDGRAVLHRRMPRKLVSG